MSQFTWVVIAIILAALLDLYIIHNWHRYRSLRKDDWSRQEKIRAWFGVPIKESDDADETGGFARFRAALGNFWGLKTTKLVAFSMIIGLVLAGQYLIGQSEPIESLLLASQQINDQYRIDVNNLDNVLAGVPLILLGGILFAVSVRGIVFWGDESEADPKYSAPALIPNSRWLACIIIGGGSFIILLVRMFTAKPNLIDTILWVTSIAGILVIAFWWDRAVGTSLKIGVAPSEIMLLILMICFGLVVGVYQLQNIPNLLMGDEGTFFETARAIALGNYLPSPFDLGVYSYPVLSSIWQAAILKVFGITLWGWRFASVFPAVLTVIPLYLLSRDLFGRAVGIVSALVLVVSPYFLAFARLGYNNSQSILIVTLCVWLVHFGSRRGSVFYVLLGGFAAGLGFLTYTAGRLGLVVAGLYFLFLLVAKSSQGQRKIYVVRIFFSFVVGWTVAALPYLIYTQQHAPDIARNKMLEGLFFQADYGLDFFEEDELFQDAPALELDNHTFFYNSQIYERLLVRGVARTLLAFHHDELVSEHFISGNLAGPMATFFYTFGVFLVLGRLRDRRFLLIGMWFFSGVFFLSIINTYPPRHQHLVPVIPVVAIMVSLGVMAFIRQVTALWVGRNPRKRVFQLALAVVILLVLGVTGLRAYFVIMPTVYRPHLEQVINWFGMYNSTDVDFVLIHAEPVHEEWRPYLFRELLAEHKFTLVDADAFRNEGFSFGSLSNVAIFYNPESVKKVKTTLQRIYPDAQRLTFYNRDHKPIAEAVIQGDVNIPVSASFLDRMLDVFTSPVIWLLIPLVLFMGYYGTRHRQDLLIFTFSNESEGDQVHVPLNESKIGFTDQLPDTEQQSTLEMGFFIRVSTRNSVHRLEPRFSYKFGKKENKTQEDET